MRTHKAILMIWVVIASITIGIGEYIYHSSPYSPNPDRIQLWLSYSYAILFAAIGNVFASRGVSNTTEQRTLAWNLGLASALLVYLFFSLRTLAPALRDGISFEEMTADTMLIGKILKAVVGVLIWRLTVVGRRRESVPSTRRNRSAELQAPH